METNTAYSRSYQKCLKCIEKAKKSGADKINTCKKLSAKWVVSEQALLRAWDHS